MNLSKTLFSYEFVTPPLMGRIFGHYFLFDFGKVVYYTLDDEKNTYYYVTRIKSKLGLEVLKIRCSKNTYRELLGILFRKYRLDSITKQQFENILEKLLTLKKLQSV